MKKYSIKKRYYDSSQKWEEIKSDDVAIESDIDVNELAYILCKVMHTGKEYEIRIEIDDLGQGHYYMSDSFPDNWETKITRRNCATL